MTQRVIHLVYTCDDCKMERTVYWRHQLNNIIDWSLAPLPVDWEKDGNTIHCYKCKTNDRKELFIKGKVKTR